MVDGRMRAFEPRAGNSVALDQGRMFLNPGSVGQPRDGDPRASYLVLDLDAGTATWGRVRYDVERRRCARCARPAFRSGWPNGCGDGLVVGATTGVARTTRFEPRVIGGRRPLQGRKPGDRRVRVERPHAPYFRYTGPGQLVAKQAATSPTTPARPGPGARPGGRLRAALRARRRSASG